MEHSKRRSRVANAFISRLPESLKLYVLESQPLIFRIPEKSKEVGDLTVYDEGDEITVVVGKNKDHRHFSVYDQPGASELDRERDAVDDAIRFIENVVTDRVRFRNEFCSGRLLAGMDWTSGEEGGEPLLRQTDEYREFTWSGQKLHRRIKSES